MTLTRKRQARANDGEAVESSFETTRTRRPRSNKSSLVNDSKLVLTKEQERRYRYLLGNSELFDRFVEARRNGDSLLSVLLSTSESSSTEEESGKTESTKKSVAKKKSIKAHRFEDTSEAETEGEEEGEEAGEFTLASSHTFSESPSFVTGGRMRAYQIQGLNWLINLYENNLNGILADEMGLGKTLQTLSLLAYLQAYRHINGPHLLIVPKSTLRNWLNEARKWVPSLRAFIFHGSKEERPELVRKYLVDPENTFDLCITSYEMCLNERAALRKVNWHYLVIDEAHRIKNESSKLSLIVRELNCRHRLLVTGTPLQNNLHELWALLNFLLPDIFATSEDFDSIFLSRPSATDEDATDADSMEVDGEATDEANGDETVQVDGDAMEVDTAIEEMSKETVTEEEEENATDITTDNQDNENQETCKEKEDMVVQLRRLLEPFLLRRLKSDVEHSLLPKKELNIYVGLTPMQRQWYRRVLEKDLNTLNTMLLLQASNQQNAIGKEGTVRLQNIAMQLRKCCNHPYLFEGAEPGPPFTTDEHLVFNAGKMLVLDKLMARWKANGNRVLLFSQMSRMLDILEDYCQMRNYASCRIDGQTAHEDRIAAIEEFNRPDSEKFVFLLTTRAGGLGINLATADTVVLYDSDWNPQVDLQAQDRAHRIGQTKQVCVFRLVSENSIEEKIIERALQKLRLDQLVIQQGKLTNVNKPLSKEEMLAMIRHGADSIIRSTFSEGSSAERNAEDQSNEMQMASNKATAVAASINDQLDVDIESILNRAEERTKELQTKYQDADYDDLQRFAIATATPLADSSDPNAVIDASNQVDLTGSSTATGDDNLLLYIPPEEQDPSLSLVQLGKRERKGGMNNSGSYGVDAYFRAALRMSRPKPTTVKAPMPRGHPHLHDFQFYPARLQDLLEAEVLAYQKEQGWVIPVGFYASNSTASVVPEHSTRSFSDQQQQHKQQTLETEEERLEREKEQALIDAAVPLTEEEQAEKEHLLEHSGFGNWSKREYHAFLRAIERHGRSAYARITADINASTGADEESAKTVADVRKYSKHFWSHLEELADYEKIEAMVERSEERMRRAAQIQNLLEAKIKRHQENRVPLHITYFGGKGKQFTEEEDVFILQTICEINYATFEGGNEDAVFEELIRRIRSSSAFRFDWFLRTRTVSELQRRAHKLIGFVEREQREVDERAATSAAPRGFRSRSIWVKSSSK